jgi:hypothetical protein
MWSPRPHNDPNLICLVATDANSMLGTWLGRSSLRILIILFDSICVPTEYVRRRLWLVTFRPASLNAWHDVPFECHDRHGMSRNWLPLNVSPRCDSMAHTDFSSVRGSMACPVGVRRTCSLAGLTNLSSWKVVWFVTAWYGAAFTRTPAFRASLPCGCR